MAYPVNGDSKQVFDVMPKVFNTKTRRMEYAFFADRSPKFLNALARYLEKETFPAGSVIITEGEVGFNMYFIYSGSVEVLVGSAMAKVATLRRGTCFGEMALFGASRRMATVKTVEKTDCLVVKRRVFSSLLRKFPEEKLYFGQIAQKRLDELEAKKLRHRCVSNSSGAASSSEDSDVDLPPLDPNYNRSIAVYGNDEEKLPVDGHLFLHDERRVRTPVEMRSGQGAIEESTYQTPKSSASFPSRLSPISKAPSIKPSDITSNIATRPSLPLTPRSGRPALSSSETKNSLSLPSSPPASSGFEKRGSLGLRAARQLALKIKESDFDLDADAGFARGHTA